MLRLLCIRSIKWGAEVPPMKVSPRYQVVIPKEVRVRMDIRPGQEFQVIARRGVITLVPDQPIAAMRGFLRGMRTSGFREKKDRM